MNLRPKRNPPLRPQMGFMRDEKTGFFVRVRDTIMVRGMRTHRSHQERNLLYKGPITPLPVSGSTTLTWDFSTTVDVDFSMTTGVVGFDSTSTG